MLYNNTDIAIPSVLSRTSIQNILGPTPTWILASHYGLLHGLISNSSAYKLWCHSVVKGHSCQTSYDLLALVNCMPTPVIQFIRVTWIAKMLNQYIYVVSTNEHIAIATYVVYFRKKTCIILAGFISYPLVRSEGLLEQQTLGAARTVMTERPLSSWTTHTRRTYLASALPPEMGGAACNAGADGGRGNADVLCANITTCTVVLLPYFSPARQLTPLAVTTVFLMGGCVAVWLVVLSAIVQLPSSKETMQL